MFWRIEVRDEFHGIWWPKNSRKCYSSPEVGKPTRKFLDGFLCISGKLEYFRPRPQLFRTSRSSVSSQIQAMTTARTEGIKSRTSPFTDRFIPLWPIEVSLHFRTLRTWRLKSSSSNTTQTICRLFCVMILAYAEISLNGTNRWQWARILVAISRNLRAFLKSKSYSMTLIR